MTLDNEQDLWDIVNGDHPDYQVIEETIEYQSRWSIIKSVVVKNRETGKFLSISFDEPATEYQVVEPNFYVIPVVPKIVATTIYVKEQ